jgi:hypothetical protein
MANHGYISSKKNLKKDEVYKDLQEINQRRFNGLLSIKEDPEWDGCWYISFKQKTGYESGFIIWIESKRKLEHRHGDLWIFYLEIVFAHELGFKYKGMISDECCSEKWKPVPKKYPTYKKYLESRYSNFIKKDPKLGRACLKDELNYMPKKLRKF